MKLLFSSFFLLIGAFTYAQSFELTISSDSILIGNTIELKYQIENFDGQFEAPDFKDMTIVSGPNYSSSVQIINGEKTSSKAISFFVKPNNLGRVYIPEAYVTSEETTLETQVLEINVYPNPDGIIENPPIESNFFFKSFDFPFDNRTPQLERKEKKSKSKKKVRKI